MNHTPGPWYISELDTRTIGPRRVLGMGTMGEVPQLQAVARVTERLGETEANARLIAAAPEMLTALKRTMDYWDTTGFSQCVEDCDCIVESVRAAIAKAEGQP